MRPDLAYAMPSSSMQQTAETFDLPVAFRELAKAI
jgi:hypothetical protein